MAPLRRRPAFGDLHAGNRPPLPDTHTPAHHQKNRDAAPLTKRSEPLLRPSRPAPSPLSPDTPTIVLGSRRRSLDFPVSTVPLLNHPKPPRRFLQSEYPSSAGRSDPQPSHPMVREYTSMGWSSHPLSPSSPVESPKRPDGLPLGENGLERTKNGNSKSPWHMMVQSPHRASPAPSSIRDPGPAPQASLPEPASRAINLGHTAWPSISSDGLYSPVCGTPSHSNRSSLSAPGSMSDHGDIQIMRATSAQMQIRPPMTFLANASDVSILAPSSLGIGYASSIEDSPVSLPESLEAECVDLTEGGLRVSQASNKTSKQSWQSPSPSPDAVEARNAYFIPPAYQQNTGPRLKRAHTYNDLKTVYALASFPGGPIEVQPELEPPADITPPRLGTPIDLAPRSASPPRTSAEPSMFPSPPRRSYAPSFRPVSLCSPSDAIEELLPVSPFQSPETSNRSKGKRSPFQQTRESLKGILLPFKGRSLIQTFDKAEQQSALKSKISGPLEVYGIKTDVRERKKSEREWREEVLRDVVGRSLSSQFRLVEETKRQQIGGSEGVPRISSGSSKSRLPIPGALLAGVPPNPSVTGEEMDSSRDLQAVMGESHVPKKAVDLKTQRLPGKGRPTSAPLLAAWSPARRSKSGRTLSELINPSIVINQPSPKRQLASMPASRPASPSPAPKLERSKSGRISRRASILNFFKKDKAKEREVHQVSPKAKKMPSTTFTITASIRSSFLALTKHHVGDPAQPQPEGRKSPRSSSATPPSTIPLRTPIHTNPDSVFRLPPSKAESIFELAYHLPEVEGGRPLLEELMARDEALGALEGRKKSRGETYGMPGTNKVLEWRKDLEEGS
ncbi:hypothetical protein B9479_000014 [Cryptococcus floricola]|uniref:Uncharacterized protein n=1 Tax=Cryptococcus floricola TaxID=2591691 RepID=A0A5D3B9I8_9TREE|nr:hypothetical protein B9479_000014 [Cryptococcus floricola]